MIFKNSDLIIYQSPFQSKLFREYNNDIFLDGTFYILKNKKQKAYKILFKNLKQNSNNNIL